MTKVTFLRGFLISANSKMRGVLREINLDDTFSKIWYFQSILLDYWSIGLELDYFPGASYFAHPAKLALGALVLGVPSPVLPLVIISRGLLQITFYRTAEIISNAEHLTVYSFRYM